MLEAETSGYYDIDIAPNGSLAIDDLFYIKDLERRKLFINGEIFADEMFDVIHHLMQYNAEDKGKPIEERQPIILYCSSVGGSVAVGFQIIDLILSSETPVYTVNTGYQYSMGFLVGLAGHKRFATKNAKFLMHDGSSFIWDSAAKVQDQAEFNKKIIKRVKQYVLDRSKLEEREYDEKFRMEWYMFADEAKEKGFVDYIIGEDCSINEIV